MTNSKVISAINTDEQRAIFLLIAYGQVADLFKVPPAQRLGFKAGAARPGP